MKNMFFLNENLQIEADQSKAVAFAYYHQDASPESLYALGKKRFDTLVEITFLDPIGSYADWQTSHNMQKEWAGKRYPEYPSFLPSGEMCLLMRTQTRSEMDNCWTRSYDDDGYPMYRQYPLRCHQRSLILSFSSTLAENVYVSLVLTKEEFLKINPDAELTD